MKVNVMMGVINKKHNISAEKLAYALIKADMSVGDLQEPDMKGTCITRLIYEIEDEELITYMKNYLEMVKNNEPIDVDEVALYDMTKQVVQRA